MSKAASAHARWENLWRSVDPHRRPFKNKAVDFSEKASANSRDSPGMCLRHN